MSLRGTGFSEVYSDHRSAVSRYLMRRGVPDSDVADVCAEVFVVAWTRSDQLPKDSELPWLLGIARNLALAHHRASSRWSGADVPDRQAAPSAADQVISHETQLLVWKSIQSLGEADQELLMLTAWDGLTTKQAAAALSISYSAARVRLHRARRRFDRVFTEAEAERTVDLRDSKQGATR